MIWAYAYTCFTCTQSCGSFFSLTITLLVTIIIDPNFDISSRCKMSFIVLLRVTYPFFWTSQPAQSIRPVKVVLGRIGFTSWPGTNSKGHRWMLNFPFILPVRENQTKEKEKKIRDMFFTKHITRGRVCHASPPRCNCTCRTFWRERPGSAHAHTQNLDGILQEASYADVC